MKSFAANRVCLIADHAMLRNGVVEIDCSTHHVVRVFQLSEEIRQTEWKGGLIIVCKVQPVRKEGENFNKFIDRLHLEEMKAENTFLKAFHVTAFNVSLMEFTHESRIMLL